MSLYKEWEKLTSGQTSETFDEFWDEYCQAEIKLYTYILEEGSGKFEGVFSELSEKFDVSNVLLFGFLDGIASSLKKEIKVEKITEESEIKLDIDFEKLYLNMLSAEAKHLYTIPQWDKILTEEEKEAITKSYKKSKTVVKEKIPGRNEPCSCGSGKKYKHCCGK